MERSSSQTRMLATRASCCRLHGFNVDVRTAHAAGSLGELNGKFCTRARFRVHADLCVMRLQYLVNDGQAKSGAHSESWLEGLKYLFQSSLLDAGAGICE